MRYGGVTVALRYYTVITIITLRYGKIRPVTRNATTLVVNEFGGSFHS